MVDEHVVEKIYMEGVREYAEEDGVALVLCPETKFDYETHQRHPIDEPRWKILAHNEGGYNCTLVDLQDLLEWLRENRPDLLA